MRCAHVRMQLAFNFVPTREYFVANIGSGSSVDTSQQMTDFVKAFGPILQQIHLFMVGA